MANDLLQLLQIHEFLEGALREHGARMSRAEAARLRSNRDQTFMDILKYESDAPQVTMAQLQFLLAAAIGLVADADKAQALHEACEGHFARLAEILTPVPDPCATYGERERRYWDSLPDHVAVFDRDYRYVFINMANAEFHNRQPEDFVNQPNWSVLGEAFFERVNRPRFDACFAGHPASYVTHHPSSDPTKLFSVKITPVHDELDRIDKVMVTSREITDLLVPAPAILRSRR